jgi:TonB family protein
VTALRGVPAGAIDIPAPEYPYRYEMRGIEGRVLLSYVIDTTGRADTSSIVVRFASGRPFAESAMTAIRKGQFRPASIWGHPVRACVQQKVNFVMGK